LQGMKEAMVEFLASEIDYNALRESPNKAKIIIMNMAFKNARPEDIDNWRRDVLDTPIEEIYDIEKLQCSNDEMIQLIKESFNTDGIFCSTVESNNLLMWAHYADQHRGAVMEFTPSVQKDSMFLASKKVHYTTIRPLLYNAPMDMVVQGIAMPLEKSVERIMDNLVYTKGLEWKYEQEYRLYVPRIIPDEKKYATLQFYPEELTSIIYGCRMSEENKIKITSLAEDINSVVNLFEAHIVPREYRLEYRGRPVDRAPSGEDASWKNLDRVVRPGCS
jgi:Protein of unknown function (DUF2971)